MKLIINTDSNRPTGGLAGALLFFFLNLNPHQGRPFRDHIREFDFVGLFMIISGVICLLIGFNSSETTCKCHPFSYKEPNLTFI
jgi:hypothetical protein